MNKEPIRCADGCGATVPDDAQALADGWRQLPIFSRWRCEACAKALDEANKRVYE